MTPPELTALFNELKQAQRKMSKLDLDAKHEANLETAYASLSDCIRMVRYIIEDIERES